MNVYRVRRCSPAVDRHCHLFQQRQNLLAQANLNSTRTATYESLKHLLTGISSDKTFPLFYILSPLSGFRTWLSCKQPTLFTT